MITVELTSATSPPLAHGGSNVPAIAGEDPDPPVAGEPRSEADLRAIAEPKREHVHELRRTHFAAADHMRIWHYAIAVTLVLLSAFAGSSLLRSAETDPSGTLTMYAGITAMAVVILGGIQGAFKFPETAEQHRRVAAAYGVARDDLDLFLRCDHPDLKKGAEELRAIVKRIDAIEVGAPGFALWTYNRACARIHDQAKAQAEKH